LLSNIAAGASPAGSSIGLLLKVGLAVAVTGVAAVAVVPQFSRHHESRTPASKADAPAVSVSRSLAKTPAPVPRVEPEAVPAKIVASAAAQRALPPLAEEARLLKQAQQALRDGKPALAMSALDEHQRRFPRGQLALERSAARVSALCGLGQQARAEREARAFLERHAGSGLSAQVEASCGIARSR
jgi:hypothetical protein